MAQPEPDDNRRVDLGLVNEMNGNINPFDIIYTNKGNFFVPNGNTHHSISVFDRTYFKVDDIADRVYLSDFYFTEYKGLYEGFPYTGVADPKGRFVWISNYCMEGNGFNNPGFNNCISPGIYDPSFVYQINANTFQIQSVIKVGSVPTNMAISPNGRYLVVSNWCGGSASIIDTEIEMEKFNLRLGENPAGICINAHSTKAYIALSGENQLVEVDLRRGQISRFIFKGKAPFDVQLGPSDRYLYVSYQKEGRVGKIDLKERKIVSKLEVGKGPEDILLGPGGRFLYVLNVKSKSLSKVRTDDMTLIQELDLPSTPRGMALDPISSQLWVALEDGIQVYEDISMNGVRIHTPNPFLSMEKRDDDSAEIENFPKTSKPIITNDKPEKKYYIIIGSFLSEKVATEKKSQLISLGYENADILISSKGRYRLSIQTYTDLTRATGELSFFQKNFDPEAWILDEQDDNP
ncbi:MAG: SPOR domain-containing protein [Bacteroidia bacterium]|nr:SPOR domain-containing protein [Bacteroidia bacterium]